MDEFAAFMSVNGFMAATFWAPFSVYTQIVAGVLLLVGLLTRWAVLFVAATFLDALGVSTRSERTAAVEDRNRLHILL
jgi:uncharacterized membrane protein YphA (DoxX/SURF4 family)